MKRYEEKSTRLERSLQYLTFLYIPPPHRPIFCHAHTRTRHVPFTAQPSTKQAHEGEQDIPRADALRFARTGAMLRRPRLLRNANQPVLFKVLREYPSTPSTTLPPVTGGLAAGVAEAACGGVWVLYVGSKRLTLKGLRAARATRGGGGSAGARGGGLVFETVEDGEVEATCEEKEAFGMWLGVAAAVCPARSD